jgi:hypothetical protein
MLNNSYEVSSKWKRPFQTSNNGVPIETQQAQDPQSVLNMLNSQYVGPAPPLGPIAPSPTPQPPPLRGPDFLMPAPQFQQPKQPFLQQLPVQYQVCFQKFGFNGRVGSFENLV